MKEGEGEAMETMRTNRPQQPEFAAVWKYCNHGLGVDIGCGTNRLSPDILAIDVFDHGVGPNNPDLIANASLMDWRERKMGAGFRDCVFDFIFSSHCLEDFRDIEGVLKEWWRKVKVGGHLVLLLPDMEGGRYPKVGEEGGNPSHRVNVGPIMFRAMFGRCIGSAGEIVQCDTIREGCTFDFVAQRKR